MDVAGDAPANRFRSPGDSGEGQAAAADGRDLHDETPGSRFWYWRGVSPAGATAMILGTAAAMLCGMTFILLTIRTPADAS